MNTDLLNAFNNGANVASKSEKMWQSSIDFVRRETAIARECYHTYFDADKANKKGIARLRNKIKRLEAEIKEFK